MKAAVLRPQALRDQQGEVRYYRKEGGTRVAVKVAKATNAALDQIELDPGIGSPTLGKLLGIPGLRTWRVAKFPLLWCYFERGDDLDVVRLLGERQDLAAVLGRDAEGRTTYRAGVMATVLAGGEIAPGDAIGVTLPAAPHRPLVRV